MIDPVDEIERLLDSLELKCTCGSGHPQGPLHENKPWYTCPLFDDSPAPGSRAAKEAELERAKNG